jgi:hypothetical protein
MTRTLIGAAAALALSACGGTASHWHVNGDVPQEYAAQVEVACDTIPASEGVRAEDWGGDVFVHTTQEELVAAARARGFAVPADLGRFSGWWAIGPAGNAVHVLYPTASYWNQFCHVALALTGKPNTDADATACAARAAGTQ